MLSTTPGIDLCFRDFLLPRQIEYVKATDCHRFTLFGGSRGPGKSFTERWRHVRFLMRLTARGINHVQTGLFSNTYKEARKRQFLPAKDDPNYGFPEWLGEFNEANLEFRFWKSQGGHRIVFGNLQDLGQYKSDQFATVGIEELTLCIDPMGVIDVLSGSLRWPGVEWTPMGFTTNPDGAGHSQVKGIFVTRTLFDHPDHVRRNPDQFTFIRALPTDNPKLPQSYIDEVLSNLPDSLRKPWLEGSWDLFEGQRFEFNPAIHMLKGALYTPSTMLCKWYRSIDYGFNNPYACGWYGVYTDDSGRKRKIKIREDVRDGLKSHQQIERIHNITEELGLTGRVEASFLDTACWKEDDDGLSIADKFIQGGIPVVQALKDRPAGWVALESALSYDRGPDGEVTRFPELQLFDCCVLTAQQITDALWDPRKPGDILHPEGFRDDALDETRYLVLTHASALKPDEGNTAHDHDRRVWKAIAGKR